MKLSDGTIIPSAANSAAFNLKHGVKHLQQVTNLKVGTIIAARTVDDTQGVNLTASHSSAGAGKKPLETVYDVKIDDMGSRAVMYTSCKVLKPFFGVNNYFDMVHEAADNSSTFNEDTVFISVARSLVGSHVVILCIEGRTDAGVIMGFLQHPARPSKITKDMGLHLAFEFNGFNTSIDKDGAFKIESNGPLLDSVSAIEVTVPEMTVRKNPLVGPFTIQLTKDMDFSIFDNKDQKISIDRTNGKMSIGNGSELIEITKAVGGGTLAITVGATTTFTTKDFTLSASNSIAAKGKDITYTADGKFSLTASEITQEGKSKWSIKSPQVEIKADSTFKVDAGKVAIKGSSGELLALIAELIEGVGKSIVNSPVGPCSPVESAPTWAATVTTALQKLKAMTG